MRLALVSDVHADHWKGTAAFAWKRAPLADVLLVAGDLHDDQDGSAEELRKAALVRHARACAACLTGVKLARLCDLELCVDCPALRPCCTQRYPLVVWVDGNHEAYLHGADLQGSVRQAAGALPPSAYSPAVLSQPRKAALPGRTHRTRARDDSSVHETARQAPAEQRLSAPCAVHCGSAVAAAKRRVPRRPRHAAARRCALRGRLRVVGLCVLRAGVRAGGGAQALPPRRLRRTVRGSLCVCCSVCTLTACCRHCVLLPHVSLPGNPGCAVGEARTGC
jgi:hypothetical protein